MRYGDEVEFNGKCKILCATPHRFPLGDEMELLLAELKQDEVLFLYQTILKVNWY